MSATPTVASPPPIPGGVALARNGADDPDPKLNGVYYTPPRLAGLLAGWALERDPKRILEPSYGEGVFLREIDAKLRERGIHDPGHRMFGVELDRRAAPRLRESGLRLPEGHLHSGDLLSFDADALGGRFDAIVGNPPYIRHHLLDEKLAARGRRSARLLGIALNGRSDAWAYFCAHLMTFLSEEGRLALVLPGSVLQADYAKPLLAGLALDCGEVQLIRIGERLFPRVQERTVVLLVDRSSQGGERVSYRSIANLKGLGPALRRRPRGRARFAPGDDTSPPRLTGKETAAWERACAGAGVARLGELVTIRIGVVTGANGFFVKSETEADALGKRVRTVPIVSRGASLRSPIWSSASQAETADASSRLLLFPTSQRGLSSAAKALIATGEREGLDDRHHCSKRSPWYSLCDAGVPDLFLPYMGSEPPRIAINDAGATCTNAIHRLWLKNPDGVSLHAIAAASWTTLYRLSAELVGRTYGGGVLKLEPTAAAALRVTTVGDRKLIKELVGAYDVGGVGDAHALADRRIMIEGLGLSSSAVSRLADAAVRLREARR